MIHDTTTWIKINTILRTCNLPLLKVFTLLATLQQWPLRHLSSSLSKSDKEKGEQLRSITSRPGNLWPCCLPWHKMTGKKLDQDIINLPSIAACSSLQFCPNRTFQRRTAAIRAKDKHNRARESLALLFAMAEDDCQKM